MFCPREAPRFFRKRNRMQRAPVRRILTETNRRALGRLRIEGQDFQRRRIRAVVRNSNGRRRPAHGVGDDLLDLLVMIGRKRLVTGFEVEHLAIAPLPGGPAAEDLAAGVP